MLINTRQFVVASAAAAAVLWVLCSALVALSPEPMTTMTGHMFHMDLTHNALYMSLTGFIAGLIGWVILAGGFAWLLGAIYNATAGRNTSSGKKN